VTICLGKGKLAVLARKKGGGVVFQILLLRKEELPYFRVLKNKYEDEYEF
jgi:hypothetical protein